MGEDRAEGISLDTDLTARTDRRTVVSQVRAGATDTRWRFSTAVEAARHLGQTPR